MFPPATEDRCQINRSDLIPPGIREAYVEAIGVYNASVWSATATLCGRTLEGIVIHLASLGSDPVAGREDMTLNQLLRALETKGSLTGPLVALSDCLRHGRNLGAHFDTSVPVDGNLATAMLDLLDYLLEYIFTLPVMIDGARSVVSGGSGP
jgi:hypothetical protein